MDNISLRKTIFICCALTGYGSVFLAGGYVYFDLVTATWAHGYYTGLAVFLSLFIIGTFAGHLLFGVFYTLFFAKGDALRAMEIERQPFR